MDSLWHVLDEGPFDLKGAIPFVLSPRAELLTVVKGRLHLREPTELPGRIDAARVHTQEDADS